MKGAVDWILSQQKPVIYERFKGLRAQPVPLVKLPATVAEAFLLGYRKGLQAGFGEGLLEGLDLGIEVGIAMVVPVAVATEPFDIC